MTLPHFVTSFTSGGVVADVAEDAMAVNPAFRRSISDFTSSLPWEPTSSAEEIHATQQALFAQIQTLRDIAPAGGQYVNEVCIRAFLGLLSSTDIRTA